MNDPTDDLEDLPQAIVARLKRAERSVSIVTPRVDRAVVDAARSHFASRPRAAPRRRLAVLFAAAATILLAVLIVRPLDQLRVASAADDVDGSGRVDILDAFALARLRAAGDATAASEERIEMLAERVVSLSRSGR
jgi:hypothetical protein